MTVTVTASRTVYLGAGTTGPFGTGFKYINNADVKVIKTLIATSVGTPLVENVDYTLVQDAATLQGTVTLTVAIDATWKLTVYRDPAVDQQTNFPANDKFPSKANENAVDKLTMIAQRFLDVFSRSARLSDSDVSGADPTLPAPVPTAFFRWNALGTAIEYALTAGALVVSAFGTTFVAAVNAAAARVLLGATAVGDAIFTAVDALAARTTLSVYSQAQVDAAIAAAIAPLTPQTGTARITYAAAAQAGWVLMNDGTIGSAASGATTRANADTVNLYTALWNNTTNAECAVSTGRGANAAADFAANKTIALPKVLGRELAVAGAGAGLTNRLLAAVLGAETKSLSNAENGAHTHSLVTSNSGAQTGNDVGSGNQVGTRTTIATGSDGSGTAFSLMTPRTHVNVEVKL